MHLTMQLMFHLTIQSRVHFQIRFHRYIMYLGKRRWDGESLAKSVICCFSRAIFFSESIQDKLGIKKFGLFQRTYYMYDTLAKILPQLFLPLFSCLC